MQEESLIAAAVLSTSYVRVRSDGQNEASYTVVMRTNHDQQMVTTMITWTVDVTKQRSTFKVPKLPLWNMCKVKTFYESAPYLSFYYLVFLHLGPRRTISSKKILFW